MKYLTSSRRIRDHEHLKKNNAQKKHLFLLSIIMLLFVPTTYSQVSNSDEIGMARISNTNFIMVVGDKIRANYSMSINHFGFKDIQAANKHFAELSDEFVQFKVRDTKTAIMHLDLENALAKNWAVQEWNSYLQKKSER